MSWGFLDKIFDNYSSAGRKLLTSILPVIPADLLDNVPAASEATATANGTTAGIVKLAADNNVTDRDIAATPAGVAKQISDARSAGGKEAIITIHETSGTYIAEADGNLLFLLVSGGGGGGTGMGSASAIRACGNGGFSGGMYIGVNPHVQKGQEFEKVVGAGGLSGTSNYSMVVDGNGGFTSFGDVRIEGAPSAKRSTGNTNSDIYVIGQVRIGNGGAGFASGVAQKPINTGGSPSVVGGRAAPGQPTGGIYGSGGGAAGFDIYALLGLNYGPLPTADKGPYNDSSFGGVGFGAGGGGGASSVNGIANLGGDGAPGVIVTILIPD